MKLRYVFALLFLAANLFGGEPLRDGSWWQALRPAEKEWWVLGWMDGTAGGTRILGGTTGLTPEAVVYQSAVIKFAGNSSDQIEEGINRFYAADFRNLRVPANEVALLASMYAKGLPEKQTTELAAALRALYNRQP